MKVKVLQDFTISEQPAFEANQERELNDNLALELEGRGLVLPLVTAQKEKKKPKFI